MSGTITVMGQTLTVVEGSPIGAPGSGTATILGRAVMGYSCPPGCRAKTCCSQIWNSGSVYVTLGVGANSLTFGAIYGGSGATSSALASALATQMNATTSPVTATVSANVITITSKVNGVATNYALSTSYRFDTTDFSNPGFTATPSGAQLTGGTD